jgi:hypothetical protein
MVEVTPHEGRKRGHTFVIDLVSAFGSELAGARAYDNSLDAVRKIMVYLTRGGALIIRLVATKEGDLFSRLGKVIHG